ncbi:MAG: hypothetical protein ABIM30_00420 [candidate division WOR-3 bacterium]
MVIVKQNVDRKQALRLVPLGNFQKITLTRTETPNGIYYVSNLFFYPEVAFVVLNNYLISSSNYVFEKLDSSDFNAVRFNSDPGNHSVVELISAFK